MTGRTRKFHSRTNAIETLEGIDLHGKTFAITGTTSGIGVETARALVAKGAHLVMINRNVVESEKQKEMFLKENRNAQIDIVQCDLSSLKSVENAAKEYLRKKWPLHCLILNAGVMGPSAKTTSDGFEVHLGVNHLAHFILIRELLPVLRESAPSRIVILSSALHSSSCLKANQPMEKKLDILCPKSSGQFYWPHYASSKMCNMLVAFKLHRDEFSNGISTYSVHPGSGVRTELQRDSGFRQVVAFLSTPFTKDASQGAATSVYCATHPEVRELSGKYWESCWDDEKNLDKLSRDQELQDALWKHTEEILKTWSSNNNNN